MMELCSTQYRCAENERREMNRQILLPKLRSTLLTDLSRSSSGSQHQKCSSACHKTTQTRITQFGEGLREICIKQNWSARKRNRIRLIPSILGSDLLDPSRISTKDHHQYCRSRKGGENGFGIIQFGVGMKEI